MKNTLLLKQSICLWFVTLTVIFITSCISSANPQEQGGVTPIVPTTILVLATETNQATVTLSPTPTAIRTLPSPTTTPAPTETPIPTLTSIPTISIEQRETLEANERLLQELMQINDNCRLPCWWGIELEENLENVEEIITALGLEWHASDSDFAGGGERGHVRSGYYNPDTFAYDVSNTVDFHTVDGRVQFINILAERPLRQYGEEELVQDWEKYSLSSMLQQYGKSSYVYLFQQVADPGPPSYELILYYPDLGFKFSYRPHETSSTAAKAELCLNLENMRQITLSLYNPEYVGVWANYLLPPALNPDAEEYLSNMTWEAQTGMDLDTFYEIYKDADNLECILVNR